LGWLIDPDDYSVLTFTPQYEPDICRGDRQLPVLEGVNLEVTAAQFFVWLKMGKR
jgi:Uma2 family endonuclease